MSGFRRDLKDLAGELSAEFRSAEPFPYVVIDGLFSSRALGLIEREFPAQSSMSIQYRSDHENKSAEQSWDRIGGQTQQLLAQLNSAPFLDCARGTLGYHGASSPTRA
jgi:hypothetical protein